MEQIGFLSYLTGALMFTGLLVLLLSRWKGRLYGTSLALASSTTVAWSLTVSYAYIQTAPSWALFMMEILRNTTWLLFIFKLLGANQEYADAFKPLRWLALTVCFGTFATMFLTSQTTLSLPFSDFWIMLLMAVLGLVTVEQAYRNTAYNHLEFMRYLYVGLASMFAYDIYLYGQATLNNELNRDLWAARGTINALIAPMAAITISKNAEKEPYLLPSRKIVFYSTSLVGAGILLFLMAAIGYYLKLYGGTWGSVLQIVLGFGTLLALIVAFTSRKSRAFLQVIINKHFFNLKYDYREEWLKLIDILSSSPSESNDLNLRVLSAVSSLFNSPGGLLFITDEQGRCRPVQSLAAYILVADSAFGIDDVNGWPTGNVPSR